jgi:hypothetical protein
MNQNATPLAPAPQQQVCTNGKLPFAVAELKRPFYKNKKKS